MGRDRTGSARRTGAARPLDPNRGHGAGGGREPMDRRSPGQDRPARSRLPHRRARSGRRGRRHGQRRRLPPVPLLRAVPALQRRCARLRRLVPRQRCGGEDQRCHRPAGGADPSGVHPTHEHPMAGHRLRPGRHRDGGAGAGQGADRRQRPRLAGARPAAEGHQGRGHRGRYDDQRGAPERARQPAPRERRARRGVAVVRAVGARVHRGVVHALPRAAARYLRSERGTSRCGAVQRHTGGHGGCHPAVPPRPVRPRLGAVRLHRRDGGDARLVLHPWTDAGAVHDHQRRRVRADRQRVDLPLRPSRPAGPPATVALGGAPDRARPT